MYACDLYNTYLELDIVDSVYMCMYRYIYSIYILYSEGILELEEIDILFCVNVDTRMLLKL